jgi:hypothetical protein
MSGAGQTLIQTIEADLAAAGGWLETEIVTVATDAWDAVKTLFQAAGAQQVTIIKSLVAEAQADENAGMGVEATVADVLTLANQKEMVWVAAMPAQALTALVGLFSKKLGL